jgi:hypothetical protein
MGLLPDLAAVITNMVCLRRVEFASTAYRMKKFVSTGLLVLALVVAGQTGALAQYADYWSPPAAKRKAFLPTVLASTNCIAQHSLNHPGVLDAYRAQNIQPVVDAVWSKCANELEHLRREHERIYGWGTGEGYVKGAYRNDLPRAVLTRIKDALDDRLAAIEVAANNAKALWDQAYTCTDTQIAKLIPSSEGAEVLAAAAVTNCGRDIGAAVDAHAQSARAKSGISDADESSFRQWLRTEFRNQVVARTVARKAGTLGGEQARNQPPLRRHHNPPPPPHKRVARELASLCPSKVTS